METLLFVILFIVLAQIFFRISGSIKFPGIIAVVMFGFMYIWNKWGPITFPYDFEAKHAAYLLLTLFIFGSAMLLGMRLRRRHTLNSPISKIPERKVAVVAQVCMLVGIAGGVLFALDIYRNLGGGAAIIQGNLDYIRDQFLVRTTTWLGAIGSFLLGAALPGIILGLRTWLRTVSKGPQYRFLLPLLFITVAVMNIVGILTGGRQMMFATVITIVGVLLYGGWRSFSKMRRKLFFEAGLVVSILAVVYFLAVINSRAAGWQNYKYFMYLFQNGEAEWFQPLSGKMPEQVYTHIVVLSDYVAYDLTSLAVLMDDLDYSKLGWGRVQGVHILRQLKRIGINYSEDFYILKTQYDRFINGPTGIGMMIADFGLVGSLLIYFWWGWLLGRRFYDCLYVNSIAGYLFCVVGFLWIMQSHMSSPLQEVFPFYGMIWTLIIVTWLRSRIYANSSIRTRHVPQAS